MLRKFTISLFLCLAVPTTADDRSDIEAIAELTVNIESLKLQAGPFSLDLFTPLMELARLQLDFGQKEEAIDTLQRAQNIAHRNEGVYSPKQLPIIALLINLVMDEGKYQDANRYKRFAFFVSTHFYDDKSHEVLNAYAELADWYMNTGQSRRASNLIKDAKELVESTGQNPIRFNILDNHAMRLGENCCNPKKLITALAERSGETTPETLSTAYLEIADSLILGGKARRANDYFKLANEISPLDSPARPIAFRRSLKAPLSAQSKSYYVVRNMPLSTQERLRRMTQQEQLKTLSLEPQWFQFDPEAKHQGFETRDLGETYAREKRTYAMVGHPILFSEDQLDQLLPLRWENNKEELSITMSFTVTETGDLQDVEIVESNAPSRLNRLITQALRRTYYRPALEAGKPITSEEITLVQTFVPREIRER